MRAGVSPPPSGAPLQRESPRTAPGPPRALTRLSPSGTEPSVSSCKRRLAGLPLCLRRRSRIWLERGGIKPPRARLVCRERERPAAVVRYLATSALRNTDMNRIQGDDERQPHPADVPVLRELRFSR